MAHRAFQPDRQVDTATTGSPAKDHLGRVRKPISIQSLLEWAFADECASIDFEDEGTLAAGYGSVGNAYLMAQRGALGCRIDGGGRSLPDPDADLVAAAVAVLPEGCGGRRMAVQIAEMARARRVPDAMVGAQPRCIPVGIRQNMHGNWGLTESLGTAVDTSGRKVKRIDVRWCPVTYTLTADKIGRARRNYLQWWSALMEVRSTFKIYNNLSRWQVLDVMPEMEPWKKALPNK